LRAAEQEPPSLGADDRPARRRVRPEHVRVVEGMLKGTQDAWLRYLWTGALWTGPLGRR
jgi:hypothetical protein